MVCLHGMPFYAYIMLLYTVIGYNVLSNNTQFFVQKLYSNYEQYYVVCLMVEISMILMINFGMLLKVNTFSICLFTVRLLKHEYSSKN